MEIEIWTLFDALMKWPLPGQFSVAINTRIDNWKKGLR